MEVDLLNITLNLFKGCKSKYDYKSRVKDFFKKNGEIWFEHGYPFPHFIVNDDNVIVHSISRFGLCVVSAKDVTNPFIIPFEDLSVNQLERIVLIYNDYVKYCMYEV